MDHQQSKIEKYEWIIENFSSLKNTKKLYSEPFVLRGYQWRISMFPEGNDVQYLSIYLEPVQSANMSKGWSRDVEFNLIVFNWLENEKTVIRATIHRFNKQNDDWGFTSFLPLDEFNDPQKGFLFKDACAISVELSILKVFNEKQMSEAVNLTTDVELFGGSISKLMDFRGLGKVEKAFVPILEEVCSHYPSLIDCQLKRSRKFFGWAFNALGRVLYFLKTKKVRDINVESCKKLLTLWEEAKAFGFDLTWLEPHVQSTLGLQNYVEKMMHVEKLKTKLIAVEVKLDAEIDLLIAKGFQVKDLNDDLPFGIGTPNAYSKHI